MSDDTKMPDTFDRTMGTLDGLPDVTHTQISNTRVTPPFGVGGTELFVVQTYRQQNQGDTIFLEHVSKAGTFRLMIPPKVANVIARQREQLTTKVRSKTAKRQAQERKDRGELPGFMRKIEGGKP